MSEGIIVGIDLGTTFSAIAYINSHGKPEVISNREGERTTPSVIFFEEDGTPVVGQAARNQAIVEPGRTIRFIKREMGNPSYRVNIDGEDRFPEYLSALILKKLKVDAEAQLGQPITRAVISVPAYFKDAQREATRQAAQMAGLEVLRIINEPTAAALAYGRDKVKGRQTILVYDFGGGTFDVSIVRVEDNKFTILGTDGNAKLGGKDVDQRLVDHLAEEFQREHAIDLRAERFTHQDLWDRAEQAKKDLSFRENVAVTLSSGDKVIRVDLDREIFRQLTEDLITETQECMEGLLKATGLSWSSIDVVLLAGGSSRIPAVRDMIKQVSGKDTAKDLNPDECVALGAAIQTLALVDEVDNGSSSAPQNQSCDIVVQDVASHSLGVKAMSADRKGYVNSIIIPRFSPIPCEEKRPFTTYEDNQKKVEIEVLQGEDPDPKSPDVNLVGKLSLTDLPPHKAGQLRIEVALRYNADGVIEVVAKESISGRTVREVMMRKTGALSSDQVSEKEQELRDLQV